MMKRKRNTFRKRRAIYLLVACQQDEAAVARELGVKTATVKNWMKDPKFAEDLEKSMQRIETYDAKYRAKQNKVVGDKMFSELHRRLATTRELQDMPLPTLLSKIADINREIRVDTPGDVTSRGEVKHTMEEMIDRYKNDTANPDAENKPNLTLVEMPEPKKKEGTNG